MMKAKRIRITTVLIVALAVVLVSISGALAGDTGWKDPSANVADTGGDGDGFELNPTRAYFNDDESASNMDGTYDCHSYYNYSFGIPTGATIDGIEVRLDWWLDDTAGTNRMFAKLSWDGGFNLTSPEMADTEGISDGDPTDIVGGPTDTWGRSWSLDEFSDDNFRVWLTCESDYDTRDFYLDWVPVKVYYSFPDLIITDKHENWIDNNNFNVSYKVKNQGSCPAGSSFARLYVNGAEKKCQDTPALGPGNSTDELTFDCVVACPSGETVNITVCADGGGFIDESDETNNCAVNFVDRDLVITDIWIDDSKIYYEIENRGSVKAPRSYSSLYVDGVFKRIDDVNELAPGKSSIESFWGYLWACTSPEDTIEVCADHTKRIAECDESNNCLTETWPC